MQMLFARLQICFGCLDRTLNPAKQIQLPSCVKARGIELSLRTTTCFFAATAQPGGSCGVDSWKAIGFTDAAAGAGLTNAIPGLAQIQIALDRTFNQLR